MKAAPFTRRRFLSWSAGLAAAVGGRSRLWAAGADAGADHDMLLGESATRLARRLRDRELGSEELVRAYLARIEEVNPWVNAVVEVAAESALVQARAADRSLARGDLLGPLHGVPMTIKDSLNTKGVVTTWGTPVRAGFAPSADATVVARLKAAGAILLGKTNTPELTFSFETNSPVHGVTNNPFDIARTAGGSSGGAAAIVSAAGTAFDVGSDTGGSVRLPSHCCGVAGLRPTSGRVPRTGNAIPPGGMLDGLTQIGPIARHVEDLALVLGLIAGPDGRDPFLDPVPLGDPGQVRLPGLRGVWYADNGIRKPTEATSRAVRRAALALEEAGVVFDERRPGAIDDTLELYLDLFNWDGGAWRRSLLERAAQGIEELPTPAPKSQPVDPRDVVRLLERWGRFRSGMLGFMSSYDVLLCPASAEPAMEHGQAQSNLDAFSYTMTYSLAGWPAAVVPVGMSPEGLPIGVQIAAPPWKEARVLAVAAHVEKALGGWRPPPL